jgi:hypothetical protein
MLTHRVFCKVLIKIKKLNYYYFSPMKKKEWNVLFSGDAKMCQDHVWFWSPNLAPVWKLGMVLVSKAVIVWKLGMVPSLTTRTFF